MKRSAAELKLIADAATTLKPMHDNVLLVRDESDNLSPGGIALPDNAKEKPNRGTVVAVGPGKTNAETGKSVSGENWAKVGDAVYFTRYGGVEITHRGQDFILVTQDHLMAKVTD